MGGICKAKFVVYPSCPPDSGGDVALASADGDGVEVCSHDHRTQAAHLGHKLCKHLGEGGDCVCVGG